MPRISKSSNKLDASDRAFHDWYRFVLSFPPHLVREYLEKLDVTSDQVVLDPFCGTGTTLVECKRAGIRSIGVEALPMPWLASKVKTDWAIDPKDFENNATAIAEAAGAQLQRDGLADCPLGEFDNTDGLELRELLAEKNKLLLKGSISSLPLHKVLTLLDKIRLLSKPRYLEHFYVALAKALVGEIANLRFGPEVGVSKPKTDCVVIAPWLERVKTMALDIHSSSQGESAIAQVIQADSRSFNGVIEEESIDAVITSPPYPNEKDYTRTTRLETVLLDFIADRIGLRGIKENLIRSNTRNVYVRDTDDRWVDGVKEIETLAAEIESRRISLGKTSGFERLYARLTKLYFGGMTRHFSDLRRLLRPGAELAYVVGDQASYLRVHIPTGKLLAQVAESLGYRVKAIDLFRTRYATATKQNLREEVLILEWPGASRALRYKNQKPESAD